jgi:hypothetical protein
VGRGYVAPKEVREAAEEAKALGAGTTTEDVLAERVAPRIREASKAMGDEV